MPSGKRWLPCWFQRRHGGYLGKLRHGSLARRSPLLKLAPCLTMPSGAIFVLVAAAHFIPQE